MSELTNKVIIVTGGSGLLGRAMLKHMRAKGAIAINAEIGEETDLDNHTVQCDVTNDTSVQNIVALVEEKYGRIDGFVNNAYPRTKDWGTRFEDISPESWKQNIDMQLNSIFLTSRHVLKIMKKHGKGSIVNIASIYGVVGPDFTVYNGTEMTMPAAYSAIKGGVVNFTRYLASYYGPFGVRVNCISPGGIFDHQNEGFVKQYESKVPMRRMGLPDDIAPAVSFLLSDDASYISGQNLLVDGGWTCI